MLWDALLRLVDGHFSGVIQLCAPRAGCRRGPAHVPHSLVLICRLANCTHIKSYYIIILNSSCWHPWLCYRPARARGHSEDLRTLSSGGCWVHKSYARCPPNSCTGLPAVSLDRWGAAVWSPVGQPLVAAQPLPESC